MHLETNGDGSDATGLVRSLWEIHFTVIHQTIGACTMTKSRILQKEKQKTFLKWKETDYQLGNKEVR